MNIYCRTKIWLNRWLRSRGIVKKDLEIVENLTFSLTASESLNRFGSKTNQHLHFIRSCYPPKIIDIRSFVFLLFDGQTLFFPHIFIYSYIHTFIHSYTHPSTIQILLFSASGDLKMCKYIENWKSKICAKCNALFSLRSIKQKNQK